MDQETHGYSFLTVTQPFQAVIYQLFSRGTRRRHFFVFLGGLNNQIKKMPSDILHNLAHVSLT
jgi:hypothetical protein